jgi:hypothetical protein
VDDAIDQVKVVVLPDGRLDRKNAAAFLGKAPKTLAEYHRRGIGPRSIMVGGWRFYLLSELQAFAQGGSPIKPLVAS